MTAPMPDVPVDIQHIAVIVPARDEEERIGAAIVAIGAARRHLGGTVTSSCVVVADSCSDRTAAIARVASRHGAFVDVVEVGAGCVGPARRLGTDFLLRRLSAPLGATWLANTDADTIVPEDWLVAQLAMARAGAEVVAGIVTLAPHEAGPLLVCRFRETYRLNPDGTHPHVHGANLGLRGDVYTAAGGWGSVANGEDHDLLARLDRARVVRTTAIRVETSARRIGRAPGGFANNLRRHSEELEGEMSFDDDTGAELVADVA